MLTPQPAAAQLGRGLRRWHVPRIRPPEANVHLRYALMALLREGEAHGYELLKVFTQRLGPFWHPNIGQVYQLLHDLERRGFVARRDERSGIRLRRLFRLTVRGDRALRLWLARRPSWPPPLRDEILIRLLAAERAGPDAILVQIARQEVEYRRYLALVQQEAARPAASVIRRLADAAALGHAESHLRWLSCCRAALAAWGHQQEESAPDPRPRAAGGAQ